MVEESLKFVWAYMLQEGVITNGQWNYYSSNFETIHGYDYRKRIIDMDSLRARVRKVGIDWEKTKSPESSTELGFEGTDSPSSRCETLLGTLYLKDGSEYMIGVGNAELRFSSYISVLKNLMDDRQRVKDLLGE